MKKPMIFNRLIMRRLREEENSFFKTKLSEAKKSINTEVPESYNFYSLHFNGFLKADHPRKKKFIYINSYNFIFF